MDIILVGSAINFDFFTEKKMFGRPPVVSVTNESHMPPLPVLPPYDCGPPPIITHTAATPAATPQGSPMEQPNNNMRNNLSVLRAFDNSSNSLDSIDKSSVSAKI